MYAVASMVKQANKQQKIHQTAASRQEDINWVMGPEGMRRFRRQIPRWEAEQLVLPEGALLGEPSAGEQWRKRQLERREKLLKELHGHGTVGRAFQELCKAGCNARWLELRLSCSADFFPFGPARPDYTYREKQRVVRAIANLEAAAADLEKFLDAAGTLFMHSAVKDWPVPLHRVPVSLRGIVYCLRESMDDPNLPKFIHLNASFRLPHVINEVRRRTADHRPHYEQMATLIGAAYGKPDFSSDDLKMLVSRSRHFRRGQPK